MDPFTILYSLEAISHVLKMPRIPHVTGTVVTATSLLHLLRSQSRGFLSLYDYGLVPHWTWQQLGFTASMLVSPLLHASLGELLTHLLPFLMSGASLENILDASTYSRLLAFSVLVPNVMLVLLTKLSVTVLGTRWRAGKPAVPPTLRLHCGFSPVLFCMTTVLNLAILAPQDSRVTMFGMAMHPKWSHFVELLLHQYLMPAGGGSSFYGRLGGIASGYLYVHLWQHVYWRRVLNGSIGWNQLSLRAAFRSGWQRIRGGVRWGGGGGGGVRSGASRVESSSSSGRSSTTAVASSPSIEELRRRRLSYMNRRR